MKKFIFIFMLMFASLSLTSCDFLGLGNNDVAFYGVAGYIDIGEDNKSPLSVNVIGLGLIIVPESDSIIASIDGEMVIDYEIQEGDLLMIWFENKKNVEIQESFPAQFGKEPDSITVTKHNVTLQQNEDTSWIFEFDFDDVSYESDFDILDKSVGDELQIWYSIVNDNIPTHVSLFISIIEKLSDERISLNIPNEFIEDFLMYYHNDNIVLCGDVTTLE